MGWKAEDCYGIDFHAPEGTPVKAMMDGVVTLAHNDMYFAELCLIIHRVNTLLCI